MIMWKCIVCGRTTNSFYEIGGWSTGTVNGKRSVHCSDVCRKKTGDRRKKVIK